MPSQPVLTAPNTTAATPTPPENPAKATLSASSPGVFPSQATPDAGSSVGSSGESSHVTKGRRRVGILDDKAAEELIGGFDGSVSVKTRNILVKEAARLKKHN